MPTFEFLFTDDLYNESCRRYRHSHKFARYVFLFVGIAVLGVAGLYAIQKEFTHALYSLILVIVFAYVTNFRNFARSFRNSPYRNQKFRVQLSETGISTNCSVGDTQTRWTAYTAARRFDDGVLLLQGQLAFIWLPFNAISEGSVEEAEEIIRGNVNDYKNV